MKSHIVPIVVTFVLSLVLLPQALGQSSGQRAAFSVSQSDDSIDNPQRQKFSDELTEIIEHKVTLLGQSTKGGMLVELEQNGNFDGLPNMRAPEDDEEPIANSDQLIVSYGHGKPPNDDALRAVGFKRVDINLAAKYIVVQPLPQPELPDSSMYAPGIQSQNMKTLGDVEGVTYIERNIIFSIPEEELNPVIVDVQNLSTNAPGIDQELHLLPGIQRTEAHLAPHFRSRSNVIVAVIDTGVDYGHIDLRNNMWINPGEANGQPGIDDDGNGLIDDIHGARFMNGRNSGDPRDDNGHGTHCAGTIAGVANGQGVIGMAQAKIMALKFLDSTGLRGSTNDAIHCIDYAISKGAHIMSNSWGGKGHSPALDAAIARAERAGILFVASAGNDRANIDQTPYSPAGSPSSNVVAVGAVTFQGQRSGFSNYGTRNVDIGAPGGAGNSQGGDIYSTWLGNQYRQLSGTSMAAPHVSGAAALILSSPEHRGKSYFQLKQLLLQQAQFNSNLRAWFSQGRELNVGFLGNSTAGNTIARSSAVQDTAMGSLSELKTSPAEEGHFYFAQGREFQSDATLITREIHLTTAAKMCVTASTSASSTSGPHTIETAFLVDGKAVEDSRREVSLQGVHHFQSVSTTLTTKLPPGHHKISWQVQVPGDHRIKVQYGGSMDIQCYTAVEPLN